MQVDYASEMGSLAETMQAGYRVEDVRSVVLDLLVASQQPGTDFEIEVFAHPVGFHAIPLWSEGSRSLRLHIWSISSPLAPVAVSPIHDHVWRLRSAVLAGDLTNRTYSIIQDPEGQFEVAYIRQVDGVDSVAPSGTRVKVVDKESLTLTGGDSYSLEPLVFHSSDVGRERTVLTLVHAHVVVEGGPRSVVPAGTPAHAPRRPQVNGPTRSRLISEAIDLLGDTC